MANEGAARPPATATRGPPPRGLSLFDDWQPVPADPLQPPSRSNSYLLYQQQQPVSLADFSGAPSFSAASAYTLPPAFVWPGSAAASSSSSGNLRSDVPVFGGNSLLHSNSGGLISLGDPSASNLTASLPMAADLVPKAESPFLATATHQDAGSFLFSQEPTSLKPLSIPNAAPSNPFSPTTPAASRANSLRSKGEKPASGQSPDIPVGDCQTASAFAFPSWDFLDAQTSAALLADQPGNFIDYTTEPLPAGAYTPSYDGLSTYGTPDLRSDAYANPPPVGLPANLNIWRDVPQGLFHFDEDALSVFSGSQSHAPSSYSGTPDLRARDADNLSTHGDFDIDMLGEVDQQLSMFGPIDDSVSKSLAPLLNNPQRDQTMVAPRDDTINDQPSGSRPSSRASQLFGSGDLCFSSSFSYCRNWQLQHGSLFRSATARLCSYDFS